MSASLKLAKIHLVLLGLFLIPSPSFGITSTSSVPTGVRALGWIHANSSIIDSSLNSRGNLEYLARPLNRSLTLGDFAKSEARLAKLRDVLNEMAPDQPGNQLLLANLYADVSVQEARSIGALFWGLTDRLMVGVIIPKITRNYNANFRADVVNNASTLASRFGNTPQIGDGLRQLAEYPLGTQLFEQNIFLSRGLKPLRSFEISGLGDIETEAQYRYFESSHLDLALKTTFRLPTASHTVDLSNVMDRELGDGSLAIKVGSLHTLKIVPNVFYWQSGVFGTWHAPSSTIRAVPLSPADDLPNLNDPEQIEDVRRHLGAQLDLDTGLQLDLWKGLISFAGSYQYSAKAADLYQGSRGHDYARLMKDTDSLNESMELNAEFSAIPLYQKKLIPIPGKLAFTWHSPLAGKNTPYAGYGRIDAILFF